MKRGFVLICLVLLLGSISATVSNVSIEPAYPNLSSSLIKVHADVSDISRAILYYRINDTYSSYFSVSKGISSFTYEDVEDGVQVFYWIEAVNLSGDKESTQEYNFIYDGSAPATEDDAPESVNHDVTVILTCVDSASGCSQTYYSVNDSEFIPYAPFVLTGDGEYQLRYYSIDNAGNNESIVMGTLVVIDTTPEPSPSGGSSGGGSSGGGGPSYSSGSHVVILNDTIEIPEEEPEEKVQDIPKTTRITGRSVVEIVGGSKGISIIVGILIIAGMVAYFLVKKRIKRKLWGKY